MSEKYYCHEKHYTMSFQLQIDKDTKDIFNHFLEIITIKSTCVRVKDLDLHILKTACKFITVSVILLFKYEEFF